MITGSSDISNRLTSWFLRKTSISAVRRIAAFPAALSSDIGLKRDENQDRVAIARGRDFAGRPYILAALSDGIGGMKDGSACAAATLGNLFSDFFDITRTDYAPEYWLKHAAQAANVAVFNKLAGKGGATLSALLITGNGRTYLLNVGDSRIYRSAGDQIIQLTVDDTIDGQLGHKGNADMGANLLQFIGIGKELEANAVSLEDGQTNTILLTSDGIHYLDQNWLGNLIHHAHDPGLALRRITETSKWCGGHDNASAAMLVPYLAIQEPFANSDIDTNEIWDPFGELQLILAYPRMSQIGSTPRPQENEQLSTTWNNSQSTKSSPPLVTTAKTAKSKRKRDRKLKTQVQTDIDIHPEGNEDKAKIPQLKIEFPQKVN